MGRGQNGLVVSGALAVVIAFIAKDLALPLFILSSFGLIDRLLAAPVFRAITRR